ncbi:UNVERIFIED_CONTAM: BAG family molecular chaperone regulator 5, mitochondrial [Sesamum radiatum]|uniref:BAG family molecular chaperone regulator 5, mitochondrial n=1 Tax=Sesamum radiatum TaxID=300843 RepID=A0AAW2RY69_SESRA
MDSPFFRNDHWYQQPNSFRGVPVYQVDPDPETHLPRRPIKRPPGGSSGPTVVRIPVHFVGSEQVDRSGSALKIQKAFRGFLVRKWLKKIRDIKVEVDEIEGRLSKSEVMELVRRDERERLRMNESLMSLLFKLDSICGVDSGVRVCRKAVIRKAIALQERIDAIVAIDLDCNDGEEALDEVRLSAGSNSSSSSSDSVENDGNLEGCVGEGDKEIMECSEGNDREVEIIDVEVDHEVKVSESSCVEENLDLSPERSDETGGDIQVEGRAKDGDESRRDGKLFERMLENNEKMMRMMTELFERNEAQTRMLNALAHRVELLEEAFVCDVMLRKKKKTTRMMKKKKAECREK